MGKRGNPPCAAGALGAGPGGVTGVGSDIIFSERRGQSQKPEEIYELVEQLVPNGGCRAPGAGLDAVCGAMAGRLLSRATIKAGILQLDGTDHVIQKGNISLRGRGYGEAWVSSICTVVDGKVWVEYCMRRYSWGLLKVGTLVLSVLWRSWNGRGSVAGAKACLARVGGRGMSRGGGA